MKAKVTVKNINCDWGAIEGYSSTEVNEKEDTVAFHWDNAGEDFVDAIDYITDCIDLSFLEDENGEIIEFIIY